MDLTGKICVITGATCGVGNGLAQGFQKRGAQVIAVDSQSGERRTSGIFSVKIDVTSPKQVRDGFRSIFAKFGRVDVLINNAGIYPRCSFTEMSFEEWRRVLEVNLDGVWRCCHAVLPSMISNGRGNIINVGSITLRLGAANLAHYQASKGGIVGLTRGLARDVGKQGIRVNCVHLGAVQTPGEAELFPDQEKVLTFVEEQQALAGRMTPASVEPVFAFLASDVSGDVTGQCLTVDRGWVHD